MPDTYWLETFAGGNFTNADWPLYRLRPVDNDQPGTLGDILSLINVGAASHGTTALENPNTVKYSPTFGYTGTDSFRYTVANQAGKSADGLATVNLFGSQDSAAQLQRFYWGRAQEATNVFTDGKVNADGSYYVVGYTKERQDLGTTVGLTYKFNADGTQAWGYAWYVNSTTKQPLELTKVETSGNRIFFVGRTQDATTGWDVRAVAFSPDGTTSFDRQVPIAGDDSVSDAKVDNLGNLVVTGTIGAAGSTVLKFGPNLDLLWQTPVTGATNGRSGYSHLRIAKDNSIFAAGFAANTSDDTLATCFEPNGTVRWNRSDVANLSNYYYDVAVDIDDNPVFVGATTGAAPIVRKLSASTGNDVAAFNQSMSGYSRGQAQFATSTPLGVAIVGTRRSSADTSTRTFVTLLDPTLTQIWSSEFTPTVNANNVTATPNVLPADLASDGYGNLYLALNGFTSTSDNSVAFVVAIDPFGTKRWERFRQGPSRNAGQWNAIAANNLGHVFAVGQYAWPLKGSPNATQGAATLLQQGPIPLSDVYSAAKGATLTVPASTGLLSNDQYLGDGQVVLLTPPSEGNLTVNSDGSFVYASTRTIDTATFSYAINRTGYPQSTPATVTINLRQIPIPADDSYSVNQGATLSVPAATGLLANDQFVVDGKVVLQSAPASGNLTLNDDGSFSFIAPKTGTSVTFSYAIQRPGYPLSDPALVTIDLVQSPIANPDAYPVPQSFAINIPASSGVLANDEFVGDGKVVIVTPPSDGTLAMNPDGSFTYSAPRTLSGDVPFTYAIQRTGFPLSDPATVTLQLVGKPVAVRDNVQGAPALTSTFDVLANDIEPRGQALTIVSVTQPTFGKTTISRGKIVYASTTDAVGFDTFNYTITNGVFQSTTQVIVKILPDPYLGALRPAQIIAGTKGNVVVCVGRNFGTEAGCTVYWNNKARTTTYVSDTELNFNVLDTDVALEGSAQIRIKNAVGRQTDIITLPIVGHPAFTITGVRQPGNTVLFTVTNSGTGTAKNVVVQAAPVNGVASMTTPIISASMAAKSKATVTLGYPASAFLTPRYATCVFTVGFDGGSITRTITVKY